MRDEWPITENCLGDLTDHSGPGTVRWFAPTRPFGHGRWSVAVIGPAPTVAPALTVEGDCREAASNRR